MRLSRLVLVPAAAGALVLAGMASASAGEVTGNGKPTNGPAHANSICTYSGQNDDPDAPAPEGGRVQNFGHVLLFVKSVGGSINDLKAAGENPGAACNGHTGFLSGGGGEE